GDGKTIQGLVAGTVCGIAAGLIQIWLSPMLPLPGFSFKIIFTISFGSLLGDLIKSFFKRRLGFPRGKELILVDQLDFVVGAWVLTYLVDPEWFIEYFTPQIIIIVLILTPIFHRITNIFGYHIKLKKEPW
ncbi:MAG TPA: CDP-2,3-bis-(O-geranylgeranyl)-sn-glycerol synthase, partial [Candidatus Methanoperedens sp.]